LTPYVPKGITGYDDDDDDDGDVSLMYELKKNGKVFTSKLVGTLPSSFQKRIYRAAVSQRLRDIALDAVKWKVSWAGQPPFTQRRVSK